MSRSRKLTLGGLVFALIFALIGLAQGLTGAWIRGDLEHLFAQGATKETTDPAPRTIAASDAASETVIVGSGTPDDPCTVEIDASVYPELRDMGVEDWAVACRAAQN